MDETGLSLSVGSRWWPVEGDPSSGKFRNSKKEGSGYRITLCMGALLGET